MRRSSPYLSRHLAQLVLDDLERAARGWPGCRRRSAISVRTSASSSSSFSISRPVRRASRMSRIAFACRSDSAKRSRSRVPASSVSADELDHARSTSSMCVDGDLEALQDVLALARLAQLVLGAPDHHLVPVVDEVAASCSLQRHAPAGTPPDERQHDHAEGGLHLRVLEQLVQHDVRDRVALQLDHDADAFSVRLVAQVA